MVLTIESSLTTLFVYLFLSKGVGTRRCSGLRVSAVRRAAASSPFSFYPDSGDPFVQSRIGLGHTVRIELSTEPFVGFKGQILGEPLVFK